MAISQEERNALAFLRQAGVSDEELKRLRDANYKARRRALEFTGEVPENLNFSWQKLKESFKASNRTVGTSASDYISSRKQYYQGRFRKSTIRSGITEGFGLSDANRWVKSALQRISTDELYRAYVEYGDSLGKDNPILSEVYRRAREMYEKNSGIAAWESCLTAAWVEYGEENEEYNLTVLKEKFGVDVEMLEELYDQTMETIKEMRWNNATKKELEAFYRKERKRALFLYGGYDE